MSLYKENFKGFLISIVVILILSIVGFTIGGWLLAPKFSGDNKQTYKAKIKYPNGPVKLTYWRAAGEKQATDEALGEFKKLHSNIAIEVTDIPAAEYETKLAAAFSGNKMPDLLTLKSDWIPRYKDKLVPAPQKIFTTKDYGKTFAPVLSKDLIYNDQIIAVAYSLPTLGLYYNSKVFNELGIKEPPKNWQELVDANSKLVLRQGNGLLRSGIALGTANINNSSSIMPLLMTQNGAIMTNQPPTKATFELPDKQNYQSSAKALGFYTSFALPQKPTYSWSDGFGSSLDAFADSKTMMIVDYPSSYEYIKTKAPSLEFGIAKVPQLDDKNPVNYTDYWAEAVSTNTKYPDVAWDFYNFMTSYETMSKYNKATNNPAGRLDLARDQQQDNIVGPFASQVATAQSYYKGDIKDTDAAIKEMINTTLSGFDSPIAVRIAAEKVTNSIKKFPY